MMSSRCSSVFSTALPAHLPFVAFATFAAFQTLARDGIQQAAAARPKRRQSDIPKFT